MKILNFYDFNVFYTVLKEKNTLKSHFEVKLLEFNEKYNTF